MGTKQRMKKHVGRQHDRATDLVESSLAKHFQSAEAYRSAFGTVRVRVIDDRFEKKNRVKREKLVLPVIRNLPEEVQSEIVMLVLLAPGEDDGSLLNLEFEHP
jgi:hypothetical protein